MPTPDLAAQARAADAEARQHKRAERTHRQAARDARQRQAAIEARCRALGIQVSYEHVAPGAGFPNRKTGNHLS